jgi:sugar lactone lactonase YvrE
VRISDTSVIPHRLFARRGYTRRFNTVLLSSVFLATSAIASAQETWAPVISFDGVNRTINGTTSPIPGGPVQPVRTIVHGLEPNAPFSYPNGFCENPVKNEWIVADTYHARILRFANDTNPQYAAGTYLGPLSTDYSTAPYGPVVDDDGTIVVANYWNDSISAFVPDAGGGYAEHRIRTFLNEGEPDAFWCPIRVALVHDPDGIVSLQNGRGLVVVLDQYNNRVVELATLGGLDNTDSWSVVTSFGQDASVVGLGPGHFYYPTGLAVDASGNIYVSDPNNTGLITIQVFDPSGNPLQTITQGLSSPWALTLDQEGRLFVADSGNNRIAVFDKFDAANPATSSSAAASLTVACTTSGSRLRATAKAAPARSASAFRTIRERDPR